MLLLFLSTPAAERKYFIYKLYLVVADLSSVTVTISKRAKQLISGLRLENTLAIILTVLTTRC